MNKRGLNTIPGSDDQSHQRTYHNFDSAYYVFAPVSEHKGNSTEYQLNVVHNICPNTEDEYKNKVRQAS